jgi:hypothetical protein
LESCYFEDLEEDERTALGCILGKYFVRIEDGWDYVRIIETVTAHPQNYDSE